MERLKISIDELSSDAPPGIFVTEVLKREERWESLIRFDAAKFRELEGLRRPGVFDIVSNDEVSDGANNLRGKIPFVYDRQGLC